MKVIFRVDSSAQIGSGHLIRCRTLAEELRRRGAEVRFICREHRGNLIHLLSQAAFPVTVLPPPPESSGEMREDYQAWLGVSGETDAQETLLALGGESADWLVVDHYGLDAVWERQLRPQVKQILVIDDLANRPHDCDVLLDQNYSQLGERRYQGLVPHSCRLLLGPRYGLLRPEYQLYRQTRSPHRGQVRRVLVFFGGTDSQNMTGKALEALSSSEFEGISVDVVVGANNPHRGELEQLVEARHSAGIGETRLYSTRPHLADLMAQADLALGAGGTTTWERCCLGLPTVVVSIAENQVAACEALQAEGVIQYLGAASHINVTQLRTVLCEWLGQPSQLQDMSVQGQLHVDGLGTQRVAECLKPTALEQLTLRLARVEDMALYYDWVNEPDVRRQSWNQEPIGWNSHQTWFQGKMADPNCYLGVLEADGLPVGQIRFDIQGEDAVIDYSLDRLVRGRGWATPLVRLGLKLLNNVKPTYLYAEVKPENRPSAAVFLRLGFQEESSPPPTTTDRISEPPRLSLTILSDADGWLNDSLPKLVLGWLEEGHRVLWTHEVKDLRGGDLCFYLSCGQLVPASVRQRFQHNLVVHESDLPQGKGWSPLTWQILEGRNSIPVTMLEAVERVDSGDIYLQEWLEFQGGELIDELRQAQGEATLRLCRRFVADYPKILRQAQPQRSEESFYPRRRPRDSQLDVQGSLAEQFSLLRVVDNERYPAFIDYNGRRYVLKVTALG